MDRPPHFLDKDIDMESNNKFPFYALKISQDCNGIGDSSFSSAGLQCRSSFMRVWTDKTHPAISELFLYRGGHYDINLKRNPILRSLQRLLNFLRDGGTHFKCIELLMKCRANPNGYKDLLSVKDEKGNITIKKIAECDVQSVMAVHLFEPLVLNAKIKASALSYTSDFKPECRFCSKKVAVGDTSLGNYGVWHGYADILLEQSLVKVEMKEVDDETLDPDEDQVETWDGSGEPRGTQPSTSKQPRLDNHGDDEAVEDEGEKITNVIECKISTSETYMPYGPQKLGKEFSNKNLSQILAQTIVNAFLQAKLKPELKNSFIPAFLISDVYITIHMYNPGLDVLLTQSDAMSIVTDDLTLNTDTMLSLWLALNMHNFTKSLPNEHIDNHILTGMPKSNFHKLMGQGSVLGIYENELDMPLGPRRLTLRVKEQKRPRCDQNADYAKIKLKELYQAMSDHSVDPDSVTSDQSVSILQS